MFSVELMMLMNVLLMLLNTHVDERELNVLHALVSCYNRCEDAKRRLEFVHTLK